MSTDLLGTLIVAALWGLVILALWIRDRRKRREGGGVR